ncbi:Fc.00g080650.m01.CDS01 [Cosmosporella sp. VM-42]
MGYWTRKDAMLPEEHFDPKTRTYNHVDTGFVRSKRGFMKRPLFNVIAFVYMLGGLKTPALGVYSAIDRLIGVFSGKSAATSFGCTSPV